MITSLRADTDADHRMVDEAYGGFDLSCRDSYGRFLSAHARALPGIELALRDTDGLPSWRTRTDLLAQDLAELGLPMPPARAASSPRSSAEAFGIQYVVQGSRLGGRILARRVGAGLPLAYLSCGHAPGEWRTFLARLADALSDGPAYEQALAAARRTFAAFRSAAMETGVPRETGPTP